MLQNYTIFHMWMANQPCHRGAKQSKKGKNGVQQNTKKVKENRNAHTNRRKEKKTSIQLIEME